MSGKPGFVFGGDRDIAVRVIDYLLAEGQRPEALFLPEDSSASHAKELIERCGYLDDSRILRGKKDLKERGESLMKSLAPDYFLSIHYPLVIPESVLNAARLGALNLHPAFLPLNRGWHTPSWALLEGTPYGATLHFIEASVDSGDVVARKKLDVRPEDTAQSLYQRAKDLEFELFREAWPTVCDGTFTRTPQTELEAPTEHRKKDLFSPRVQQIDLNEKVTAGELLKRLRALTTNKIDEAAYFTEGAGRYRVQVTIVPENNGHGN